MIIKTDKETRDRMCWLLRKEIADYAVHGAKNWLGTSINRELWEMTIKDTEDLICIHNLIKDNEISLAFESASGLETAVRDEIPTEVWNWMSNVWAGNEESVEENYVEPGPTYKESWDKFQLEVPPKKSHNTSIENKIMTAQELIEELEYAIERNGNQDVEVLIAQQPKWPFEYTIEQAVMIADVDEDEEDDRVPPKNMKVYLGEGSQIGYLNENASRELGW